jgi:hypothetical protein
MAKNLQEPQVTLTNKDLGQIANQVALHLKDCLSPGETGVARKEWLNTREAAAYLGVGAETLEIARHLGNKEGTPRGPAYAKWGAKVRYKVSDLDAWMEAHRVERHH